MSTPARRRLFWTPQSAKRARFNTPVKNPTTIARRLNRRTAYGPRSGGSLTQQVKSLQRAVRSLAPEVKYTDVTIAINDLAAAGTVVHLSAIAAGDTISTRTANTIQCKSVSLILNWGGYSSGDTFRFYVVQDKQQFADASPAVLDVLSTADPRYGLPNASFLDRFRILYASELFFGLTITAGGQRFNKEFMIPCNFPISYNDTASSDIQKNGIYLVAVTTGSGLLDVVGTSRIAFTDV